MSYILQWNYRGNTYTTDELAKLCGKPRRILADRLANGWEVEAAVSVPVAPKMIMLSAAEHYENGPINIVFTEHISGVFAHMQPVLHKQYTAHPHCASNDKHKAKLYYTIVLDNGKPLIVYPGEFVAIGGVTAAA